MRAEYEHGFCKVVLGCMKICTAVRRMQAEGCDGSNLEGLRSPSRLTCHRHLHCHGVAR